MTEKKIELNNNSCKKCGQCCKQGGPALHQGDLELIKSAKLPISSLITIRKGELAHNPLTGQVQAVKVELVKLLGKGKQWDCCYYDEKRGCTIYDYRPVACRVLECWDTSNILQLVEKDTLSRRDILGSDHVLLPVIEEHEKICPCEGLEFIRDNQKNLSVERKREITQLVRQDLRFRARVIQDFELKLQEELFYFGRPYFQLLQPFGIRIFESGGTVELQW